MRAGGRRYILTAFMVVALLIGAGLLAYPSFSNLWNVKVQTRAVASYDAKTVALSRKSYEEILSRARDYNEALREMGSAAALIHPDRLDGYAQMLDITGTGIMGYITIEKINVKLPIYHGTEPNVLSAGAGHLEGSSLPIGGESSHSVISAHRGLPSAKLFTRLSDLEKGDFFTLTVLDENYSYQVDQIKVVLPTEFENLYIEEGKDFCTLMTCTPYGINTHRLLVRGVRSELPPSVSMEPESGFAAAAKPAVIIFLIFALILFLLRKKVLMPAGKRNSSRYPDNVCRREKKRNKSLNRRRRLVKK